MVKIKQNCSCVDTTFTTTRGIQVDVEIDKDGEHIKDLQFGDYYDKLGENKINCSKCDCKAEVIYGED